MTDAHPFKREPDESRPVLGGVQHRYTFTNGYGASVVQHFGSYGGPDGKWELAVIGRDGDLAYDTPITSDVIGWQETDDIDALLDRIEAL